VKEVVVAGIPRCGTTYLFRCLAGMSPAGTTPKGPELERLPIMKTHGLAPPNSFKDPWSVKTSRHMVAGGLAIFLFGDPVLAVISTRFRRWRNVHARNCGFFGKLEHADIYRTDCFNYEKMFDTWTSAAKANGAVLALRYETLYENRSAVEKFLGRTVRWNPWRKRNTAYDAVPQDDLRNIVNTYQSLIRKVRNAPDVIQ